MAEEEGGIRYKAEGGPVPLADGFAVYRRYSATVDRPDLPYILEIELDLDDEGRRVCRSLRALQREDGPEVNGVGLRQIPVANIIKDVLARAMPLKVAGPGRLVPATGEDAEAVRPAVGGTQRRRGGRKRLSDDELDEVAQIYRAALQRRESNPSTQVAVELGVAPATGRKRVMEARKRGFLGPTDPGRSGERKGEG